MSELNNFLKRIEDARGCLIAKPGTEFPSCHEFTRPLCDHKILQLTEMIRVMAAALTAIAEGDKNESWNPHQLLTAIRHDEHEAGSALSRVEELAKS